MKKFINSEVFGGVFVTLTALFVIFSCFYLKINNINPRHIIGSVVVNELAA